MNRNLPEKIYKETSCQVVHYLYDATLENGVVIHVREDGSAVGSDGKIYYNISRETGNDDLELIGWSSQTDHPQII